METLSLHSGVPQYADCTLSMNDRDEVDDPCAPARGILLSLLLCSPFWVGVYVTLF